MEFPVWLKGIAAAFVGGAANVIVMVVTDPVAFNFGEQWRKTAMAALAGGVIAVACYLQKSPIPTGPTKEGQS